MKIPAGVVIETTKSGQPGIPAHVARALDQMTPRVFLRWNKAHTKTGRFASNGEPIWEPRWEIWCEVEETSHPDASNVRARTDLWNHEAKCWMRRLQTYQTAEGEFAPLDWGLIEGLRAAERAFEDRLFYERHIAEPHRQEEEAKLDDVRESVRGSEDYYRHLNRTLVGPAGSGDWRWRIR